MKERIKHQYNISEAFLKRLSSITDLTPSFTRSKNSYNYEEVNGFNHLYANISLGFIGQFYKYKNEEFFVGYDANKEKFVISFHKFIDKKYTIQDRLEKLGYYYDTFNPCWENEKYWYNIYKDDFLLNSASVRKVVNEIFSIVKEIIQ